MDVINLSIGTPDFQPDAHVMQAVAQAATDPENYKYSMNDTPELIQAVQDWYARRYDVKLDADQIMSVSGSQEGIAHVAFPFAGPGDLVLAPDPGYPIFTFGPMMTGAELGLYPLYAEGLDSGLCRYPGRGGRPCQDDRRSPIRITPPPLWLTAISMSSWSNRPRNTT